MLTPLSPVRLPQLEQASRSRSYTPFSPNPHAADVWQRSPRFGKNLPHDVDPAKPETWRYGTYVLDNQVLFKVLAEAKGVELLKIRPLTPEQQQAQKRLQYWQRREATHLARIQLLKQHEELKPRGTWIEHPNWHEIWETGDERLEHQLRTGYNNTPAYYRANTYPRGITPKGEPYPGLDPKMAQAKRRRRVLRMERDLRQIQENIRLLTDKVPCITQRVDKSFDMTPNYNGAFTFTGDDFKPGDMYMYRITHHNGQVHDFLTPDMWSKYQPEGVHGPSQVVDTQFDWPETEQAYVHAHQDVDELTRTSIYNVHVGTVKKEGTFADVAKMAPYIKAMGFTHVQLMPIGQFAGPHGWGYDQVGHFATHNAYGTPKDLQKAVATLHANGLGVIFDVVFNHLGPEGNYHGVYDPKMMNPKNAGWGHGHNFCYVPAMQFAKDYLKYLTETFHADGFRWDQAQAILHPQRGDTDHDAIKALTHYIHNDLTNARGKYLYVKAETHEADPVWTRMHEMGGFGFHAKLNLWLQKLALVALTNRSHDGVNPTKWGFFDGLKHDLHWLAHQVVTLMSKDEVGNHHGKHLHALIDPPSRSRLAPITQFLLMRGIPQTLQGDEYGETKSRFNYFTSSTDHDLTTSVASGDWLTKPQVGLPNDDSRYLRSILSWQANPAILNLNRAAQHLRLSVPAFYQNGRRHDQDFWFDWKLMDQDAKDVQGLHRWGYENPRAGIPHKDEAYVLANFNQEGVAYTHEPGKGLKVNLPPGQWVEVLNTADPRFFAGDDGGSDTAYTNTGKTFEGGQEVELALAPHGALVLRRLNPGWNAEDFAKEMTQLLTSPIPMPNGQEVTFPAPEVTSTPDKPSKRKWFPWR